MTERNNIPDWEEKYNEDEIETMPWFYPELDPDFEEVLQKYNIKSGAALDIGTGPGTQAIALAKLGFNVAATDISASAIKKASEKAGKTDLNLSFIQDDILNSKLNKQFDVIFDRGCFHVFQPEKMPAYVKVINALLKNQGFLFLKCYSHLEYDVIGPYPYRPDEIEFCFSSLFNILSIKDTVFYGPLKPMPKALFCVLKKS